MAKTTEKQEFEDHLDRSLKGFRILQSIAKNSEVRRKCEKAHKINSSCDYRAVSVSGTLGTSEEFGFCSYRLTHLYLPGDGEIHYHRIHHTPPYSRSETHQIVTEKYVETIVKEYREDMGDTGYRGRPYFTQVIPETLKRVAKKGRKKILELLMAKADEFILPREKQKRAPV